MNSNTDYIFHGADLGLKRVVEDGHRYHEQDRIKNKGVNFSQNISLPGELLAGWHRITAGKPTGSTSSDTLWYTSG